MSKTKVFTNENGVPVADNTNIMTAGPRGPALLQDIWLIEKLANFDREVIPERRMHAKGWGAYGTFTVTQDITRFTKGEYLQRDRQADARLSPLLDRRRRAWRSRRRARHSRHCN
jgi:catalase